MVVYFSFIWVFTVMTFICVYPQFGYCKDNFNVECPNVCTCLGAYVDCTQRNFHTVPAFLPGWTEQLDLSSNQLHDNINSSVQFLSNLTQLRLNRNKLTALPILTGLYKLQDLHVSHNAITHIQAEAIAALPSLILLDLSGNAITHLKANSFPLRNSLTILILNSNRIKTLEKGCFDNLTQLTELKLNRNRIKLLSKDLFKNQKKLKLLELNRNKLDSIISLSLKPLEQLEILKLRRNSFGYLNDGAFWGLKNISILELDGNSLSKVSKGWLYGLESLSTLSLAGNLISVIEQDGWDCCQRLHELDLSNNHLQAIGKNSFEHLSHLERLILNGNQISIIQDGAFSHTPELKDVELNNNKISSTVEDMKIEGAFSGLNKLTRLSLTGNHVKSINSNAFSGLENLSRLDLSNNNITSIQDNAFAVMPQLQDLVMNTSSLLCDCKLQWLSNWLRNTKFPSAEAKCGYPLHLRGQYITDLQHDNFTCGDSPKPYLIEEPETKMTLKGDNVTLRCRATSSSSNQMTFIWKHDNVEIRETVSTMKNKSNDGRHTEALSQLTLFNVSHSDAGKYQCIVENGFGTTYSRKAHISVLIFPTFSKIPQNISVPAGETARLECAVHGFPIPEVAWQKDGGHDFPAARERRMQVMPNDDVFFIINAKYEDTGIYSCTAHNAAGDIVANATLTVLAPPSFSKPMENKEIKMGGTIVLQCMAGGMPKPVIVWSKDGSPLAPNERHFFTAENQLLIIVETKMTDSGKYECELTNSLGTKRGYTQLYVLPVPMNIKGETNMMGIIIITVVCCAVGTSVVWVVIIYQTRRRLTPTVSRDCDVGTNATDNAVVVTTATPVHSPACFYTDNMSEHSSCKDSGMGDSAKRSSDDLVPEDYAVIVNECEGVQPKDNSPGTCRSPNFTSADVENTTNTYDSVANLDSNQQSSEAPLLQRQHPRPTNHERMSLIREESSKSDSG